MGLINLLQRGKERVKQATGRVMQCLNSVGVKVGQTLQRGFVALNWNTLAGACADFVQICESSRLKWKDRADRAQRNAVLGENTKPKNATPTKEKRALAENCIQIIENNIGNKTLNETLANQTKEERMDFIQKLADDFQKQTGVELNTVQYYVKPGLEFGYYDREDNSVHINAAFLTSSNVYFVKEQIFTLFHEMTHALQWQSVLHAAGSSKTDLGFPREQVAEWADNFLPGHYVRPEVDFEDYRNQPIERDAYWLEWQLKNQFD